MMNLTPPVEPTFSMVHSNVQAAPGKIPLFPSKPGEVVQSWALRPAPDTDPGAIARVTGGELVAESNFPRPMVERLLGEGDRALIQGVQDAVKSAAGIDALIMVDDAKTGTTSLHWRDPVSGPQTAPSVEQAPQPIKTLLAAASALEQHLQPLVFEDLSAANIPTRRVPPASIQ